MLYVMSLFSRQIGKEIGKKPFRSLWEQEFDINKSRLVVNSSGKELVFLKENRSLQFV